MTYHLVAAEEDAPLRAAADAARESATFETIALKVRAAADVEEEEAAAYVDELIDSQFLQPTFEPGVAGPEPLRQVLDNLPSGFGHDTIEGILAMGAALDSDGVGSENERHDDLDNLLGTLVSVPPSASLIQVDLVKPMAQSTLDKALVDRLVLTADLVRRLNARGHTGLANFVQAFRERFDSREVPLCRALDEEVGVGFPQSEFLGEGDRGRAVGWHAFLLDKYREAVAAAAPELHLESQDLEPFCDPSAPQYADSIAIVATLAGGPGTHPSEGTTVMFRSAWGPSAASWLARFSHADPDLLKLVRSLTALEQELAGGSIVAELAHLPEGRVGNVLSRPVLREYEIPYLTQPRLAGDKEIRVTDLLVSVVDGRVRLWSRTLEREILPRTTTAHNVPQPHNLPMYRFLYAVSVQGAAAPTAWSWGPLETASYLPRVYVDGTVVSERRWRLDTRDVRRLQAGDPIARFNAAQSVKLERQLPRCVFLREGDQNLLIDFNNCLSVDAFGAVLRNRGAATLVEVWPEFDSVPVTGPEGRYLSEIVVPCVSSRSNGPEAGASLLIPRAAPGRIPRRFLPGSEWLFLKLYAGPAAADRLLVDLLKPLIKELRAEDLLRTWFFLRYADPARHIRVRFKGDPKTLRYEIQPRLDLLAEAGVNRDLVWRATYDTYEREVERYGGGIGVAAAEEAFCADSDAALELLGLYAGDEGLLQRQQLSYPAMDMLLSDFGFDSKKKCKLLANVSPSKTLERQWGDEYRAERAAVASLLDGKPSDVALLPGLAVLNSLSRRIKPIAEEFRAMKDADGLSRPLVDIALSFVHMHMNRTLRADDVTFEGRARDFVRRHHRSVSARR